MDEKVDFRSYPLMTIGALYFAAVAYELGPEVLMTLLGLSCFLMALIIPGKFRVAVVQEEQEPQRTWFES